MDRYSSLPCFGFELPTGFFYGFPLGSSIVKIAAHRPGEEVRDPSQVDRQLHPSDLEPVANFGRECLPDVTSGKPLRYSVCMYTMSADQHFVIDHHPLSSDVVFAAGFSGHGFKFAPAIGEILSDLALRGDTRHPINFLRLR
jgi:sarcosine oxidase